MQKKIILENEANQRLDKYLSKLLKDAPKSFLYKMMRKKNIVLNGKKSTGNEKLQIGDEVKLFLSDETITKFKGNTQVSTAFAKLDIIYEDEDVLFINKPAGMLSQKATEGDVSLVEYMTNYLLKSGALKPQQLDTFHPALCNRLDRNTSGLIVAGKSLRGLQTFAELLQTRKLEKYYLTIVKGVPKFQDSTVLKGYLYKDSKNNQVHVSDKETKASSYIETSYRILKHTRQYSLLCIHLITGKPHQIRAHLAYLGYPVAGDTKYGDFVCNRYMKEHYGLKHQLLHSWCLHLFDMEDTLPKLSNQTFYAVIPKVFRKICEGENLIWEHGIPED